MKGGNTMVFRVPDYSKENWEEDCKVKKGQYLCYECNHPQLIKTEIGYLEPCPKCNSTVFWGM